MPAHTLTQLEDVSGYEPFADELGEAYPGAMFSPLRGGPSPAAGVLTTTSGGIAGTDILGTSGLTDQPFPEGPPISAITGQLAPTPEEIAYKGLVNDITGAEIFGASGEEVASDPPLRDYPWAPFVYNKPAQGLVTSMPLVSTTANMANKYLQGGTDAFSISGPQGYADVRQQLLGGSDVFTGPQVNWQRLGQPAPSDKYFGANFPTISENILGGIEIPKPGDPPRGRTPSYVDITPEKLEINVDNLFDDVQDHYRDLQEDRTDEMMRDAEAFWTDVHIGSGPAFEWKDPSGSEGKTQEQTGIYGPFPEDEEGFLFYKHPGVTANITTGLGRVKGFLKDAAETVGGVVSTSSKVLKGVLDELTRFTERKGGRGSTTEGDAFGLSAKGYAEALIGILTLDFKELDKQGYGDLQIAALIAAAYFPPLLGLQAANELKDFLGDSINVSAYNHPEYKKGLNIASIKNNLTEFVGNVLRPLVDPLVRNTLDKIDKNPPEDGSLKERLQSAFGEEKGGYPKLHGQTAKWWREQLYPGVPAGPQQEEVSMEAFLSRQERQPEHIPTSGEVPTGEGTEGEVRESDPLLEGPSPTSGPGSYPPIAGETLGTIDIKLPEGRETVSPYLGRGVSAGPESVVGSTLPARETAVDVKSLTVEQLRDIIKEPETKLIPTAGQGVGSGLGSAPIPSVLRPRTLPVTREIETAPLIDIAPQTEDEGPFKIVGEPIRRKRDAAGQLTGILELPMPPTVDPLTGITGDKEEYKGAYTDITYPIDKDGNPYRGDDVSEIARWKTTPVGTTDISKIKEIFGDDVGEAYAKYGEGSKIDDTWKGQGNKPLDLRNADLQRQKEEWTTQKQEELEKEFTEDAAQSFVDTLFGYDNRVGNETLTEEEWLKKHVTGAGSFKGGTMAEFNEWRKRGIVEALNRSWKSAQKNNPETANLVHTHYRQLLYGSGILQTKANIQKVKDSFSGVMKDFAKENVLLDFKATDIEDALDSDRIKMLDNLGIKLDSLRNVGGADALEGRANVYMEPLEQALDDQFTGDTVEKEIVRGLADVEFWKNMDEGQRQSIIDDLKEEGKFDQAAQIENLAGDIDFEIDPASAEFDVDLSTLEEWMGFQYTDDDDDGGP
jgi:hypothetical protein